jgi:hypothetical protein
MEGSDMPEVSDFVVVIDGAVAVTGDATLDRRFATGGRNRGRNKAVLVFNLRGLAESNVNVKVNDHVVGSLLRHDSALERSWHSQQIVFDGDFLRDGDSELEIDPGAATLRVKDVVLLVQAERLNV